MSTVQAAAVFAILVVQGPVLTLKLDRGSDQCGADQGPNVGRGGSPGRTHHGPLVPSGATVLLEAVNRTAYTTGDPLTFSVLLENTSTTPLIVPVLPTSSVCSHMADEGARRGEIQLRARTSSGKPALIAVAALWSLPSQPESQVVLQPGQSVRVGVSRTWEPLYAPEGLPEQVALFVRVEGISAQALESRGEIVVRAKRGP
jgi:hypothetical protein